MTKIHLQTSMVLRKAGWIPTPKPLTDEQIRLLVGGDDEAQEWNRKVVKAIERAHGIKSDE